MDARRQNCFVLASAVAQETKTLNARTNATSEYLMTSDVVMRAVTSFDVVSCDVIFGNLTVIENWRLSFFNSPHERT